MTPPQTQQPHGAGHPDSADAPARPEAEDSDLAWPQEPAGTQAGARRSGPRAEGIENSIIYRWSCLVYQAAALVLAVVPLLAPAELALLFLDGASAWSLVLIALSTTLAFTTLPALVYAVTRPGWMDEPAALRRARALWRGWAGSVVQFGPLAFLAVALVMGLTMSADGVVGGWRLALISALAVVLLLLARAGTICALFSFGTQDLVVLSAVMSLRDPSGTLFLSALGAAGLYVLLTWPAMLMLAWVPLCLLTAPATRRAREILTDQFTAPAGS
ncbi:MULTISPECIES: hypothetical protein [unclassified Actinomyces]|uniref:hypothetical protein n=1 Tax=unclassified Actinomyces TaxID=2609248 RepID=UPI002016D3D4|nr:MULTISPECIES: hypothetical protein [unclassified Actinomyces]MCL3777163.1 hypothetical protein [Actinomyces sp. AC-20-1]MCL3789013.1 hypothetical protein [Actinomyces sp. 187325]MCL3791368.1 hypothetical protein [Actinomyces sp. 186855]MCL3793921.1 hypothetical protein [Actinomyces sp. 217892]